VDGDIDVAGDYDIADAVLQALPDSFVSLVPLSKKERQTLLRAHHLSFLFWAPESVTFFSSGGALTAATVSETSAVSGDGTPAAALAASKLAFPTFCSWSFGVGSFSVGPAAAGVGGSDEDMVTDVGAWVDRRPKMPLPS
jgi:hypothetical protein